MNIIELNKEVGFFFSCFREKKAVEFCISNIREFYMDNPIFLASDGGDDFSYLSNSYKNFKFELYDDVLGYVNNPEFKDKEKLIDCCIEFLRRLNESIIFCNTDFIVYYEPDILLRNKIKIQEDLKINGSYSNEIEKFVLDKISQYNKNNINKNFGSCGGSVIRTDAFLDVYNRVNREILTDLIYTDPRISNCDYLLTVLFSIFGYEYKVNFDFVEANRGEWRNTNHSIVHQFHLNYNEDYIGKYK